MTNLLRRSVIGVGNEALFLVIQKPWTRYYGLKARDRLEVIANEKLTVRPIKQSTNK